MSGNIDVRNSMSNTKTTTSIDVADIVVDTGSTYAVTTHM